MTLLFVIAGTVPKNEGGIIPSLEGNIPDAAKWIKNGGKVTHHSDGSMTYVLKNGTAVQYSAKGFPDFSSYLYRGTQGESQVSIALTGNRNLDEIASNAAGGFEKTPIGYTWHHNEDTGLMQLIETEVHNAFSHTGGFSINKN